MLRMVDVACALCGSDEAEPVWETGDRAFAIPGVYAVARCRRCGLLYQRPRVHDADLAACYPDEYPRHQEPSLRLPLTGSPGRVRAARHALASSLGYDRLAPTAPSMLVRLRGGMLARTLTWHCPPWRGQGRYLDVGCGSGATLGVAKALGWKTSGIEVSGAAAARARRYADELHVGDALDAPFAARGFDVVSAFHVIEHVPDPVAVVRRMLGWLDDGGLVIIEVPNAGGLGARLFGRAWSGLELPRHLFHFTPETLRRLVELAGGHVVWERQQAKPRHYIWSLRLWLGDHSASWVARLTERRAVYGVVKLALELMLPLVSRRGVGEVIRVGVVPAHR
jgi:SAM-dependent methyltransferase